MLTNMGFWSLILNGLVLLVSISGFIKITRNDLMHLEANVKEIKEALKRIEEEICKIGERVAMQEGKCKANHG